MADNSAWEDYELETLSMIRKLNTKLNILNDEEIANLYREWSAEYACESWFFHTEHGVKCFCEWATTAPCDRNIKTINKENEGDKQ